jgi:hypothetical protein
MSKIPTSRAPTPTNIPSARPAFAPPDMPWSAPEAAAPKVAVAEARPVRAAGALGVGALVATMRVVSWRVTVAESSSGLFAREAEGEMNEGSGFELGPAFEVGFASASLAVDDGRGRTAGSSSVLGASCVCVTHSTSCVPKVLGAITMRVCTTVSTCGLWSSSSSRPRWRRTRCAFPWWCAMVSRGLIIMGCGISSRFSRLRSTTLRQQADQVVAQLRRCANGEAVRIYSSSRRGSREGGCCKECIEFQWLDCRGMRYIRVVTRY